MIAFIEGYILWADQEACIIKTQGMGYKVYISQRFLAQIKLEEERKMWIHHAMHDGQSTLFGFQDVHEQNCFLLLIKISGISGRLAQKILSFFCPSGLAQAILEKNTNLLKQADGVGEKLAQRLVHELQGKFPKELFSYIDPLLRQNVFNALTTLGYRAHEAQAALDQASSLPDIRDEETLLTACLNLLSL